jgi:uncharacterized protein YjiK
LTGIAEVELKVMNASIEWLQACAAQAAKASSIAGRTLEEIRTNKATLSDAAQRFIDFSKDNANVMTDVSARITKRYAESIQQVISPVVTNTVVRAAKGRTSRSRRQRTSRHAAHA